MVVLKRAQITICESDQRRHYHEHVEFLHIEYGSCGCLLSPFTDYYHHCNVEPTAELSLGNPMQREVTTTLKVNNKHQIKVSTHCVFFPVCKYIVLVYPTGFDFFHSKIKA